MHYGVTLIMPSTDRGPLAQHPTALALRKRTTSPPDRLSRDALRELALAVGADDADVVSIDHPDLAGEVPRILAALPGTRTLVSLVLRMHPDSVRSPARSVANLEFHSTGERLDEVARKVALALAQRGHRALNPAMAFPMEMDNFPERTWIVSHKLVAVAAQLGRVGIHRNVIHPRFGSFILLATVLTTAEVEAAPLPLTFDPCVSCKLCVGACPVGAIEADGEFRFSACYDHNYREFMTGFGDVLEAVADSRDHQALRERMSMAETASMWQSLAYQPNYKAAHCVAVCPAGEDQLGALLDDRARYVREVVRPLTDRREPVYVVDGSDAEAHVRRRFPHKPVRLVRSSLRPASARGFFRAIPLTFQHGPAAGWRATLHFEITGADAFATTVRIDNGRVAVEDGLTADADLRVVVDGQLWLDIVTKRRSPVWALVTRRLTLRGDRTLLMRFARCFPR